MPRMRALPESLTRVLEPFRLCFTTPTFATFVTLLAGPVAGAVMDRISKGLPVAGAPALLTAGLIVAGFACGVALPVLGGLAVDIPDQRHLGMASGVNNTVLQIGISVGIAGHGAVLGSGTPTRADLDRLFPLGATIALTGAVVTAVLLRGRSRPS